MANPKYVDGFAVTTSDTTTYNPPVRALYIGGAGDVTIITVGGHTCLFTAMAVKTLYEIPAAKIIKATGTSATLMVAYQ